MCFSRTACPACRRGPPFSGWPSWPRVGGCHVPRCWRPGLPDACLIRPGDDVIRHGWPCPCAAQDGRRAGRTMGTGPLRGGAGGIGGAACVPQGRRPGGIVAACVPQQGAFGERGMDRGTAPYAAAIRGPVPHGLHAVNACGPARARSRPVSCGWPGAWSRGAGKGN